MAKSCAFWKVRRKRKPQNLGSAMRILIQCLVVPLLAISAIPVSAQSRLPPCPGSFNVTTWTDCLGTYTWPDGQTYNGGWKNGEAVGQGTTTFSDGGTYIGEYRAGKFHGHGSFTYPSGSKYVGEWKNGWPDGQGTVTLGSGEKHTGEWRDNKLYAGERKDGKAHGRGTTRLPDGRKYVGEFRDGKYNGRGTYTWPSGDKYVGEYRDDKRNGHGTYTHADGEKYVGQYLDNEPHGKGAHTYPDGRRYVGEFRNGKFDGLGTYTNPDGRKYVGQWQDGRPTQIPPREGDSTVIAKAIGLGPIGKPPPGAGDELRIWAFSHRITRPMLVLRETPAGVDGELILWWGQAYGRWMDDPSVRDMSAAVRKENAAERKQVQAKWKCAKHVVGTLFEACRVALRKQPDWPALLRELVQERVWDLPDSSTLPRNPAAKDYLDPSVLLVEARRNGTARWYNYVVPSQLMGPEVRNADRILTRVGEFAQALEASR
jgi:hypothetical protein